MAADRLAAQVPLAAASSKPATARCFVALLPEPAWCRVAWQALYAWPEARRFRVVSWRQWHLTLAFLGDVSLTLLPDLAAVVADLPISPAEPLLCPETAYWARARVIVQKWTGVSEQWYAYVAAVREALRRITPVAGAVAWVPHVTLVRGVREPPRALPFIPPSAWRQRTKPLLFRSWLKASGAYYEKITLQSGSRQLDAR